MSKTTKIWLITAASLVMLGVLIIAAVMAAYHWDFTDLSTEKYETNTYEINEEFSSIKLNTETADVLFAASDDDVCRVVCYEEENMKHSVGVQNDTLTIISADDREWYEHIGINTHSPKVTIYLPDAEYASLGITGSTGDIEIADEIKFDSVDISLSTGDIVISDVTCIGDMKASVTTGEVRVMNVTCQNLLSSGSTGDISLKNVIAAGKLSIERSTGDVVFDSSDATEIFVKTDTGDVTGSLLSGKVFIPESSTGDVSVPKTTTGGKCEIITSTGDVEIEIC